MDKHFYISKDEQQEVGLFGDTICLISKLILASKKYNSTIHLYSESGNVKEGWPQRWYDFLGMAIGGNNVLLETTANLPAEAEQMNSVMKPLEDGSSPYFRVNWDLIEAKVASSTSRGLPKDIQDFSNYITWARRYRKMECIPLHLEKKYKNYKFINLSDDYGHNVHGLQRKFNVWTSLKIMKECYRYVGVCSGGIHLAALALPPSRISIIPDPCMYKYERKPNWQGMFYDQMGYRIELPILDQDHHYKFLQNDPFPAQNVISLG